MYKIPHINGTPAFTIVKRLLDMGVLDIYNAETGKYERAHCMFEENGQIKLDTKVRQDER